MSGLARTTAVYIVVALVVGLIVGAAIGRVTAPAPTATPAATPAPAVGLSGEVPIAALIPLTGVLSTFGAQYRVVAEEAVKEVNDWLASIGRQWRLKLIVEDTGTDPAKALDKMRLLHAQGVKIFIGVASSGEVRQLKTYADANKLLVISPSSTAADLALKDYVLRYTPNDIIQGKAIAKIMWERGIRYVVPIWRGDTWGDGLKRDTEKSFMEICKASGERCGFDAGIRYDPAAKEFAVEASKLNDIVSKAVAEYGKDKVGVLMISFEEAQALIAAASKYPVLSEVKWQGSDGTAGITQLLDPSVAPFVIKVQLLNTAPSGGISPLGEKIRKLIREKLGQEPLGYTYYVYDIVWTLALAIDQAGKYDVDAILNVLPQVLQRYMGASGYIVLDENGDRAVGDYDLWAVVEKDGKYEWKIIGVYSGLTGTIQYYS